MFIACPLQWTGYPGLCPTSCFCMFSSMWYLLFNLFFFKTALPIISDNVKFETIQAHLLQTSCGVVWLSELFLLWDPNSSAFLVTVVLKREHQMSIIHSVSHSLTSYMCHLKLGVDISIILCLHLGMYELIIPTLDGYTW